jgi:putative membrane protein
MKRVSIFVLLSVVPVLAIGMDADEDFLKSAAEGGLTEVSAGKLAENKATTPELKDFAGMMVKDHSTADQKLWKLASGKNVTLPGTGSAEQVAAGERLKLLSGKTFDKAYIRNQITAHRDTIALFKKEIATGKDAQARQFAAATLPTVEQHLDRITKIASAAGVDESTNIE